jgi:hypothetical protein
MPSCGESDNPDPSNPDPLSQAVYVETTFHMIKAKLIKAKFDQRLRSEGFIATDREAL